MENVTIKYLLSSTPGAFEFYDNSDFLITAFENDGNKYEFVELLDNCEIIRVENTTETGARLCRVYVNISPDNYRICNECGRVFDAGFMDECGLYLCEYCLEPYLNKTFGVHGWMAVSVPQENDGYYLAVDGSMNCGYFDTGIFYTEWF